MLKRKVLIGAPVIVEEALMIIVPLPIGSAETKKSVTPSVRKFKAQEGYFIGWMLSNDTGQRGPLPDGWLFERVPWRAHAESVANAGQRASVWSALLGSCDHACHDLH